MLYNLLVTSVAALLVLVTWLVLLVRRSNRVLRELEAQRDLEAKLHVQYAETMRRMDDETFVSNDPDNALEWLRNRQLEQRKRNGRRS